RTERVEATRPVNDGGAWAWLSRALAPVTWQMQATYTWRNWAGVLLIMGGITGGYVTLASGGLVLSAIVLLAGVGAGLAILRWGPTPA
ncbi:MAG: hypothetical protein ACRDJN_26275, partial [Chloroflexota bacterium]